MKTAVLLLLTLLPFGAACADAPVVRTIPKVFPPAAPPAVPTLWTTASLAPRVPVVERVPQAYLVFGYGTDRQGKGPYLDIHGNALPMNQFPQAVEIRGLKGITLAGLTPKPLVPAARRAAQR